jgi:hypothetical protein
MESCDQKVRQEGQKSLRKISPVEGLHFGGEMKKEKMGMDGVAREEGRGEVVVVVCMQSMWVVFVVRHIVVVCSSWLMIDGRG